MIVLKYEYEEGGSFVLIKQKIKKFDHFFSSLSIYQGSLYSLYLHLLSLSPNHRNRGPKTQKKKNANHLHEIHFRITTTILSCTCTPIQSSKL